MESSYSIEYQVMYVGVASILFGSAKLYIWDLFINKNMKIYCFYHKAHTERQ
jgi:hypothetical protein